MSDLNTMTSGTTMANLWSSPERVAVNEYSDSIEMIYKETSMVTLTILPYRPPQERVFKIVFSCVDGKWKDRFTLNKMNIIHFED